MIFWCIVLILAVTAFDLFQKTWSRNYLKWAYGTCMLAIVVILCLFGLGLTITVQKKIAERKRIVCLVDISASMKMSFTDIQKTIQQTYPDYNIHIVPFSDRLAGTEHAYATAMVKSLSKFHQHIQETYTNDEVVCGIIITDGNETEDIPELIKPIELHSEFPYHVLYIKHDDMLEKNFDKSVMFIEVPRFIPVYEKTRIRFSAQITGGHLQAVPIELRLDGKNLGSVLVNLDNGYGEGEFDLILSKTGQFLLEASVAVDSREKFVSNNTDNITVESVKKGIRVLHISGHPSVDTAFIRRGLQNIPGVDMISFYILRTHSQASFGSEIELSLIPFPTNQLFMEELPNFDLIIINDFYLSEFLSPAYINNIVKFVESGGGLIVFGGEHSFIQKDYISTRFEDILPVIPSSKPNWHNGLHYLVKGKELAAYTALSDLKALDGLTFKGINRVEVKKTANTFFTAQDGIPLIAGGLVGKGRVVVVLTDSFWKLSYEGNLSHDNAIKPLIRYVTGISPMPVKIQDHHIGFDPQLYNQSNSGIQAKLEYELPDGTIQTFHTLTPTMSEPLIIADSDPKRFFVTLIHNDSPVDSYQLIHIEEKRDNELTYVHTGQTFLKHLTDQTHGQFITSAFDDLSKGLSQIKPSPAIEIREKDKQTIPLYQHKGLLLVFLYLVILSYYLKSKGIMVQGKWRLFGVFYLL
ncbi:MAG: hypothetical protein HQK77_11040 [Desulfobacterales bacterium]|nr:hypothetical protein [Desulfobacterales bacterium]